MWIRHFGSGSSVMMPEKPLCITAPSFIWPQACNDFWPCPPSGLTLHNHSFHSSQVSCPGPPHARPQWGWGVDRRLVQGQGPSSLITPIQLQRQKPRAFDISFILVFCSFVPLGLCRRAAGVSIITSCLPELHSMDWKVTGRIKPTIFKLKRILLCLVLKHEVIYFSLLFPFPHT